VYIHTISEVVKCDFLPPRAIVLAASMPDSIHGQLSHFIQGAGVANCTFPKERTYAGRDEKSI
jgi:hypothetical protein